MGSGFSSPFRAVSQPVSYFMLSQSEASHRAAADRVLVSNPQKQQNLCSMMTCFVLWRFLNFSESQLAARELWFQASLQAFPVVNALLPGTSSIRSAEAVTGGLRPTPSART